MGWYVNGQTGCSSEHYAIYDIIWRALQKGPLWSLNSNGK